MLSMLSSSCPLLLTTFLLILTPTILAQFDAPSAPFALVLLSSTNSTLNGTTLETCHEGAAVEGLCPTYEKYVSPQSSTSTTSYGYEPSNTNNSNQPSHTVQTFTFNTSSSDVSFSDGLTPGYLIYDLPLSGGSSLTSVSEPLSFSFSTTSNVAIPLFMPSQDSADSFVFDNQDRLSVQGYIDDTTNPITIDSSVVTVSRWQICETYFGYDYITLAWVVGKEPPQNPTCQAVEVARVFV